MPSLITLPNELLGQVIQQVPFKDIEAFSLTCRTINENAEPKLREHRDRKHKLSTITIGRVESPCWLTNEEISGIHPLIALRDTLIDDENALYPKTSIVGPFERSDLYLNILVMKTMMKMKLIRVPSELWSKELKKSSTSKSSSSPSFSILTIPQGKRRTGGTKSKPAKSSPLSRCSWPSFLKDLNHF